MLRVVGARGNNLKNVTGEIPLGTFTCITGVSGGGKSTFTIETLYKAPRASSTARAHPAAARRIEGLEHSRQGHRHRPVADRPHPALQPGHLYRRLHADPRLVRRPAGGQGARLQAGALQLQRQGRPLRGLPGRRRDQDRDALPARRLRHLRRLQGQALQPRDPGSEVQGQVDRRRARHDRRGGADFFKAVPPDPRQDGDAQARRPRLRQGRPAGHHAVGRRGPARQAVQGAVASAPPAARSTSSTSRPPACTSTTSRSCWKCSTSWSTRATPWW
jgi:energy-coupling factor transporter ATP-binding protein EcfA2